MGATHERSDALKYAILVVVLTGMAVAGVGHLPGRTRCRRVSVLRDGFGASLQMQDQRGRSPLAQASPHAEEKFFSLLKVEDAEETLPEITIQGKQFTVVIHKQRLVWPAEAGHRFDPDDDETARSFEVRDAAGAVAYRKRIEDASTESNLEEIRKQGRFTFTEAVYATRMQGAANQALVVGWSSLPSAPDACSTYVVLGLFEGKLVPFSEPFCEDVVSSGPDSLDGSWNLKREPGTNFETFEIRRGYGFFRVVIPIRVDFLMARLFPARWCIRTGAPALLAQYCEFTVEAERFAPKEDTFVRLFPEADESATPRHVVVKPGSRVEFLAALAPNAMDRSGRWRNDQGDEIPWLKVRIDGKEGWVHAEEDLNALGLFQAG
jgi:hypothetical protein